MPRDTGGRDRMSAAELRYHLAQIGQALTRIEARLGSPGNGQSEARGLTPSQWLKIAAGLALPLAALLLALSGNIDAARKLLAP